MDLLLKLFQIERAPNTTAEFWFDASSLGSTWILLVMLALVAILLPWRTLEGVAGRKKAVIMALRVVLVASLSFLLLKPSIVLLSPLKQKEKLAVLVDASRSMSIATQAGQPTRWKAALDAFRSGPLTDLAQQYDLEFYTFGRGLNPQAGLDAVASLNADEEESDLSESLQQFLREGRDLSVGALLVLSDGIERGGLRRSLQEGGDEALKRALSPLALPVYTASPGRDDGFVDLSIEDLKYNEFAFLRQPFTVQATLKARGLAGTSTTVRLSSGGATLGSRRISLPADGQDVSVTFEINPERVGKFTYTLETPVLPKEAVAENNRRSFTLKVVRDKIRVLQVAGAPSWDVKFLRRLLKSDPNIDLVSFFILRGPSDQTDFDPDEYSLIEFPYQDLFDRKRDLGTFDLAIFQNFAYRPYLREQSERLLTSVADYVREGGGLAMLGGEMSFAAGDYGGSPLEEVLPGRMDRSPSVISRPVGLEITPQGLRHPVTLLHFDPAVNKQQWEGLPQMDGFNPISLYSDSVMLAKVAGTDFPLLAVRKVGKGRSMALTTDTSWYWSFKAAGEGKGNLAYLRFWKNAMRWLVGDPDEGQLQLDTDRENYRLGDETVIQVKVMGADYGPVKDTRVSLDIRLEDGSMNGWHSRADNAHEGSAGNGDTGGTEQGTGNAKSPAVAGASKEAQGGAGTASTDSADATGNGSGAGAGQSGTSADSKGAASGGRASGHEPIHLEGVTGADGELVQRFRAPKAGPYRIRAVVSGSTQVRGSAETVFTVSEEGPEMKELGGDKVFLEALARVTSGKFLDLSSTALTRPTITLKARPDAGLSQRSVVALWDRLPPYFGLMLLLCAEWLLRRRWGLR